MIVITGGIGCGKSVICQLLKVMGHAIYDCDSQAKRLMTEDALLRQQLCELFGPETYLADSTLNKTYIASCIFSNADLLTRMNELIHPAVARDIKKLPDPPIGSGHLLFVETAIHFESGFNHLIKADQTWCVAAPLELRIERAMKRDNTSREKILARMENQLSQEEKICRSDAVIWNDNDHSVIEQVNRLLTQIPVSPEKKEGQI